MTLHPPEYPVPSLMRNYMDIPNQYAKLAMSRVSQSLSEFWCEVCEQIISDGVGAECAPSSIGAVSSLHILLPMSTSSTVINRRQCYPTQISASV
jgi:hypothetical protein